tara:strand:- start:191 stop:457 length:267 start_codon:yes stop_codon:yes gene_type:complete
MVNWIEVLGCFAGVLTSFAFVPQIFKLLRTKYSNGISIFTYFITLTGCFLWLIYGVFLGSFALIAFNVINIITSLMIIYLSKKYQFSS